jgi:hypothetical protein
VTRPLLIIACSGPKLAGVHRAIDLYQGVMFQVLRKWVPAAGAPDIYILSAKHGLVHSSALVESYEQPMTEDRQHELIAEGLLASAFLGKGFDEVFIAGGAMYRAVAEVYVARLRKAGFITKDAPVRSCSGGIGEQRGQLGAYLRELQARVPLPHFKKGDVLVRRKPYGAATDEITLLEDTDPIDGARVRTPAEGALHIKVQYVGDREKVGGRWRKPIRFGKMDNVDLLRNFVRKGMR